MRMLRTQNSYSFFFLSANQLSIYGAVLDWSEQFALRSDERVPTSERSTSKEDSVNKELLKSVNKQEVNPLVCAPRTEPASGNRLRENLQNPNYGPKPVKLRTCIVLVRGQSVPDMDDGCEDFT